MFEIWCKSAKNWAHNLVNRHRTDGRRITHKWSHILSNFNAVAVHASDEGRECKQKMIVGVIVEDKATCFLFVRTITPVCVSVCLSVAEHVSGVWAEQKTERAENGVSGSGADSGLNRPLKVHSHQHCADLVTDYLTLTYPRSAFYYSISILALTIFQIIIYCTLACSLLIAYWNTGWPKKMAQ